MVALHWCVVPFTPKVEKEKENNIMQKGIMQLVLFYEQMFVYCVHPLYVSGNSKFE